MSNSTDRRIEQAQSRAALALADAFVVLGFGADKALALANNYSANAVRHVQSTIAALVK